MQQITGNEPAMPIVVEKAWMINKDKLMEPWFYNDEVFHGATIGKAKLKAIKAMDGMVHKYTGKEFNFLTIPLVRAKYADKLNVGGEVKYQHQIDYNNKKQEQKKQLTELLANNPNSFAYIKKGGYYYRPNNCGYTEYISMAGIYKLEDAIKSVLHCSDNMQAIIINTDEHNQMINERIADLQTRLIPTP